MKKYIALAEPSVAKVQIDWIRENQFISWKNDCYNFLKNLIYICLLKYRRYPT